MKARVFGFRQDLANEYGLTVEDLVFIDWFIYAIALKSIDTIYYDEKMWGHVTLENLRNELPILFAGVEADTEDLFFQGMLFDLEDRDMIVSYRGYYRCADRVFELRA